MTASRREPCEDFPEGTGTCWTNDGTGLWCPACLREFERAEIARALRALEIGLEELVRAVLAWWAHEPISYGRG